MARERNESEWAHTSEVLAMLANCNRDPKKKPRPFKASQFNPYRSGGGGGGIPIKASNIRILKKAFVDGTTPSR